MAHLSRNPEKVMDRAAARTMQNTDLTEGMTEVGIGHSPNPNTSALGADASRASTRDKVQNTVSSALGNTGIGDGLRSGGGNTGIGGAAQSAADQAARAADTAADAAANRVPRDHQGGTNPLKAFGSKGSIGSQFEAGGAVGQVPQKIGGPFDKEGVIGKQFTSEGVIGGAVDETVGDKNPKDPLGRYDNKK
ncbi:hypothetical protein DFH27DRAFT_527591 [Peziza echinospora]|nr:hypothetical protein DFH27DRAFT_527591 [Peziza echinospora]